MDVTHPIRSVIPSVAGGALEVLAGTAAALSGRQVARLVRPPASQKGVLNALNDLVETGLVLREDVPPAALFRLNRQHLAAEPVLQLVGLRQRLIERISERILAMEVLPAGAALFGSVARGDGDLGSDIDLILVRANRVRAQDPLWTEQLQDLAQAVEAWTGNTTQIVELSATELRDAAREQAPLIAQITRDGVDLMHGELTRMVKAAR